MWRSSGKKTSASKAVMIAEERVKMVNAGAKVKKGDRLSDLMDDVRNGWDQAKGKRAKIESRPASSPNAKSDQRCDHDAGDAVAVGILRPNIVVAQEAKLEE